MESVIKFFTACVLTCLIFLVHKERAAIYSFVSLDAKETFVETKPATETKKISVHFHNPEKPARPILSITDAKRYESDQRNTLSLKHSATINKSHVVTAHLQTATEKNGTSFFPEAFVHPNKNYGFKMNTDVSKLTKEISVENIKPDLKTTMSLNDSSAIYNNSKTINAATDASAESAPLIVQEVPLAAQEINEHQPEKIGNKAEKINEKILTSADVSSFSSAKQTDYGTDSYSYLSLYDETEQLKKYAARNGYNTNYVVMVNLGIKSSKKRFFIIDFSTSTIIKSGIVAEGSGDIHTLFDKKYSNEIGSSSSSLGMYKIGKPVKTKFSYSYSLHGLQQTNNNAFKRSLMLEASESVPYDETDSTILKTNGSLCLSAQFLNEISVVLNKSAKPVLLWIYDPSADNQPMYSSIQK